ncbi:uncharacterized protein CC84DRAFT_210256 [Paraphaeosphaeria sporulosa]|uniref:Uncharacterized protein n=1 Tax=Paraphaeosphaeria sporulosa TaxID=1460663 RepID=A0A177C454_9PLEO|nr:uncharacterized protein CC84DRAFT_210256 [Paraphaeosphaeria sporulosa]OAG01662.1 hypothetical protein CC84DRAFT_210256 [Paraphaeosphaeria sporulosa]
MPNSLWCSGEREHSATTSRMGSVSGGVGQAANRRLDLDRNSIPACLHQTTPHFDGGRSRRTAITIRHAPRYPSTTITARDGVTSAPRGASRWLVGQGHDSRDRACPVTRRLSRRPAETCRRHHMPIARSMAHSCERQTAIGSENQCARPCCRQLRSRCTACFAGSVEGRGSSGCGAPIGGVGPGYQSQARRVLALGVTPFTTRRVAWGDDCAG